MARQKLIHLHGSGELTKAKVTEKEIKLGEIAVRHSAGNSELYVVTDEGKGEFDKFINATVIASNLSTAIKNLQDEDLTALSNRIAAFEEGGANSVEGQIEAAITELTGDKGQVGINTAAITGLANSLGELSGGFSNYQKTNDEAVQANAKDIATLNGDAEKAGSVANTVKVAVDALANGQVKLNKDAIDILNGTGDGSVAKAVAAEADARSKADAALSERIAAFETGDSSVAKQIEAAITELTGDKGQVGINTAAIEILNGNADEAGSVAHAVNALANGQVKLNKDAIDILNGTGDGSVAKAVADLKDELLGEEITEALKDYDTIKEIAEWITSDESGAVAMANRILELEKDTHTHGNKALLDTYTQTEADLKDAVDKKHDHSNKAELDKIAEGDKAKWDDAYAKRHEHSNKSVLDGIDADKVAAWDAASKDATDYVDTELEKYLKAVTVTSPQNSVTVGTISNNTMNIDLSGMVIDCGTY